MKWKKKVLLSIFLLNGMVGCSTVDTVAIGSIVEGFATGVAALAGIIKRDFSLAEKVHTKAFTNNLEFQLEIGQDPDVMQSPLLSSNELAARTDLLNVLNGYAQSLAVISRGHGISADSLSLLSNLDSMRSLDQNNFNMSHSLSKSGVSELFKGVGLFERIFDLPDHESRLAEIFKSGRIALEKTAMLLYLDLGESGDQDRKCNYGPPNGNFEKKIRNLILCRGGLRGHLKAAIKRDLSTWKRRLALTKKSESAVLTGNRGYVIRNIVSAQQTGQQVDQVFANSQKALLAMVAAHDQIIELLKDPQTASKIPAHFLFKPQIFVNDVASLETNVMQIEKALEKDAILNNRNSLRK
jgi:hypothetical protein